MNNIRSAKILFAIAVATVLSPWASAAQALLASQEAELAGSVAAVSGDGTTAVTAGGSVGHAYVFRRSASTWVQEAELVASDGAFLGGAVALSSDGAVALIGASHGNANKGAAYVFVRSGTTWTEQADLTASDGAVNDEFGSFLALSRDGSTALIGAYLKTVGGNLGQGAAYVFVRSGTTWTQQAELTDTAGQAFEGFGWSVALGSDGGTALIGAPVKAFPGVIPGAAYVFARSGTTWTQAAELTASDGADSDYFGHSAALSSDGTTAMVGAYGKVFGTQSIGAAYAFVRGGATWTQQAKLTAGDGADGDYFGWSAGLSSDGSTALIGAAWKTVDENSEQGAAYLFARGGTTWVQQAKLTASDGAVNDKFGWSGALSDDGATAVIGGGSADAHAYVFAFLDLCGATPMSGCAPPAKAKITLAGKATDPSKRKLGFKWTKGTAAATEFGDPLGATSYAVCIYSDGTLVMQTQVLGGGICDTKRLKPCWKDLRGEGFSYSNRAGNANGLVGLKLKAGEDKASVSVKGKGWGLSWPLPLTPATALTVQVIKDPASGPECWEAVFPVPAKKNVPDKFIDQMP